MSTSKNTSKKKHTDHGKIKQDTVLPTLDEYLASLDEENFEPDEKTLYKCSSCGYEEYVPNWLIDEMIDASEYLEDPKEAASMECPECNGTMRKKLI